MIWTGDKKIKAFEGSVRRLWLRSGVMGGTERLGGGVIERNRPLCSRYRSRSKYCQVRTNIHSTSPHQCGCRSIPEAERRGILIVTLVGG